jgi:histone H3/H4
MDNKKQQRKQVTNVRQKPATPKPNHVPVIATPETKQETISETDDLLTDILGDVPADTPKTVEPKPKSVSNLAAKANSAKPKDPAHEGPTEDRKPRTQTNNLIGVCVSAARVRRHIDKLNINKYIDEQLVGPKQQLSRYNTLKSELKTETTIVNVKKEVDDKVVVTKEKRKLSKEELDDIRKTLEELKKSPEHKEAKAKIAALSQEKTRFSNAASIALSIVCDELVSTLVRHIMKSAIESEKKIIHVDHLHNSGVDKLYVYPLVKSLPSFIEKAALYTRLEKNQEIDRKVLVSINKLKKEYKKKYGKNVTIKKSEHAQVIAQPEATPSHIVADVREDEEVEDHKTSFKFYVHLICKKLIEENKDIPEYKSLRISTEIKEYLSDLLVEFIQRISPLVRLTTDSMKNKTVNDVAILRVVEAILIDGKPHEERLTLEPCEVIDPEVLKEETAKKEAEKAAGRKYKIDKDRLPKVPGYKVVRNVHHPNSGYEILSGKVKEKLELYKNSNIKLDEVN